MSYAHMISNEWLRTVELTDLIALYSVNTYIESFKKRQEGKLALD